MTQLEIVAREKLVALLTIPISAQMLKPQENMTNIYGLTSLNKILFITSLCNEMHIDLYNLTETDLANMHTLSDVIEILSGFLEA